MRLHEILPPRLDGGPYSCAALAKRIGKHPNTLRKYEVWTFIRPVPRLPNGYRAYSREHALEALFAATVMRTDFKDWRDHRRMKTILRTLLAGDYETVRAQIRIHRRFLRSWLEAAVSARRILQSWRRRRGRAGGGMMGSGRGQRPMAKDLSRPQAAAKIGVAPDTLRDWERNGLFAPVRLPNGRRRYSPAVMEQIAVVRVLRRAGYSLMGIRSLVHGPGRAEDLSHARDRWDDSLRAMIADCRLMEEIVGELENRRRS